MGIVVQKYGGSSVSDVAKIGLVADTVVATKAAGHDVVVVVSAMGKTTDQLLALAREVDEAPPRRELDMLLTTGERVSMALLSMAIQKRGVDAISFTGSQSGIITNDRHFDARIIEVRPHRIEDELSRGKVVIIAGYQGMSYKREITTLGRGGSDTTALAMAAALSAERAEIYSDVDGVYTADPRVVRDASHLPEIGYAEMQEMAESGAKVLHAGAVEFARRARISIHARATFAAADGSARETVVHDSAPASDGARAVVGQHGIVRVVVDESAPSLHASLQAAIGLCEARGVVARDIDVSEARAAFHVVLAHAPEWPSVEQSLIETLGNLVSFERGLGFVTVVGDAFGRDHRPVAAALVALSDAGIEPRRLSTTPMRLSVLLDEAHVDDAVRALHRALL